MAEKTFSSDFRRNLATGIAALFPVLITVFLFSWLFGHLDKTINGALKLAVVRHPDTFRKVYPDATAEDVANVKARRKYADDNNFPTAWRISGVLVGIVVALVVVYLIGFILRGYFGTQLVRRVDRFFERFPVIKSIYPHARKVADVMFGAQGRPQFRHVVAVQYPRRGVYTVGFLTGEGLKDIEDDSGQGFVTVFIPTSPAPMTGFVIIVPRDEVTEIDMSVEEAVKFCVTAGMVANEKQRPWAAAQEEPITSVSARLERALGERDNAQMQRGA